MNENALPSADMLASYIGISTPHSWRRHYPAASAQHNYAWLDNIDFAEILHYYDFPEFYYPDRLSQELLLLRNNDTLNLLCWIMHYILLHGDPCDILEIWNWGRGEKPFFLHGSHVICVVALLAGQGFHVETMHQRNYDEAQIEQHRKGIRSCWIKEHETFSLDGISFGMMAWGSYYLRGHLVTIGRLQYEYGLQDVNPTRFPVKDANYLWLHIPSGNGRLEKESVQQSLTAASQKLPDYFPELSNKRNLLILNSWLLSPQLAELLPQNSNILQFQQLFTITDYYDGTASFLTNLFHIKHILPDFSSLPESTSLQRGVKTLLLQGKGLQNGSGYLIINDT